MTEKMEEWMYDFAWRGLDTAFQVNDRLDNKAMNITNFSSLIIPIITGILILIADKPVLSTCSSKLLMISLISLIISIIFAFMAMWLKDQGIIKIKDQFSKCSSDIIDMLFKIFYSQFNKNQKHQL